MWILPKQLHTLASVQDTGALSLDLNDSSQLCAQSLFVRSKLSPLRTWLQKWKRDSWTQHLFGRILKPSLGKAFEIEWTSLLAVTPANLSAQQESELGKTTQDTCGPGLQMELLQCDQNYVSLKTSKDISRWGCPTLSRTWQEWVIERRGAYSARLNAVRHTNGSACLSWPSPVVSEVRQGFQDRSRGMKGSQESLTTVVIKDAVNWPTPEAFVQRGPIKTELTETGFLSYHGNQRYGAKLSDAVICGHPVPDSLSTHGSRQGLSGKLNSRWVETLLGLPIGWTMPSCTSPMTIVQTSCASLETVLCLPAQR